MNSSITSAAPQIQQKQQHLPLYKHRREEIGGRGRLRIKKFPKHSLAYSIIPILVFLCWLPDLIVALKDVSVTIPQAVKRGSNAMLTCNYDMENDTLYSVKWYKGRREFYRYTPKENPAMKVFPSQSGLNVERNLSNQSHVVLLAVPLNISGKFTCEISVEAPSFQTAMVSGEMEVVELPEEQATVTGIQPRYRIGDLVDGNCSIKYSKPAANLTWTINGIVVPPHHIKTYQIEKYEETNLESVMSAVHFMVTTQHFIKGQMRLKCTASIFDIFKEEIESIIEEDRPRIMASGQSYPPDHGYGSHGDSDGYEHNESYLTYLSAPKSSASSTTDFALNNLLKFLRQNILKNFRLLLSSIHIKSRNALNMALDNKMKNSWNVITHIDVKSVHFFISHLLLTEFLITAFGMSLIVVLLQIQKQKQKYLRNRSKNKRTEDKQMTYNCIETMRQMMRKNKENFVAMNLWLKTRYSEEKKQQQNENCYQDNNKDDCQPECGQRQRQQKQLQHQHDEHYSVANQNIINEENFVKDTNIDTTQQSTKNKTPTTTVIDYRHQMSQTLTSDTLFSTNTPTLPPAYCNLLRLPPSLNCLLATSSLSTSFSSRKTCAHDSLPLYAVDASKRNNAKYMSRDQTLLMTSPATASSAIVVAATSNSSYKTSQRALDLESKLLPTSVPPLLAMKMATSMQSLSSASSLSPFSYSTSISLLYSRNNYLMAFIGELLLHQC